MAFLVVLTTCLSLLPSSEKVTAAASCATKAPRRAITLLLLQFRRFLCADLTRSFHILLPIVTVVPNILSIIKRQLGHCWDGLGSKERQIVDIDICMIVRGCDNSTIGLAGVVDKTRGSTHEHPVADIAFALRPHVETEEVVVGVSIAFLAAAISFFARDDLSSVRIDELAFFQVDLAPKTLVLLATEELLHWIYSPQPRFLVLKISKGTFRPCWTTRLLQLELQLQRALHSKTCQPWLR